jgi:flagellar basal-body rod protein FlgB
MFENLNLFQTAHAMARHAGQRQALVARNMANADTPNYQPSDLTPFAAQVNSGVGMKATRAQHLNAGDQIGSAQIVKLNSDALSPNGNGISVEEEMLRAVDVKRQHDRALAIYRHTLTVLRSSLGRK